MKIEIDTSQPLTPTEKQFLQLLLGEAPAKSEEGPATVEDVAKQAATLIEQGERTKVKEALAQVGAERIRELTPEQAIEMHRILS